MQKIQDQSSYFESAGVCCDALQLNDKIPQNDNFQRTDCFGFVKNSNPLIREAALCHQPTKQVGNNSTKVKKESQITSKSLN